VALADRRPYTLRVGMSGSEEGRGNPNSTQRRSDRPSARWWIAASLLLLSGLQSASADIDVQTSGGLVTIRARNAPLADVLTRLSQATGFKIIYEGRPPSQLVTVTIEGSAESEVVGRVLEGLGLNYTFQMDARGTRVETLILSAGSAPIPATGPPGARPETTAVAASPPEPSEAEQVPELAEPEEEQAALPDSTAGPMFMPPVSEFAPGTAPSGGGGSDVSAPAPDPSSPSPGLTPPSFPGPASQPFPLPHFPAPASNPPPG